jgi:hypothetical protein
MPVKSDEGTFPADTEKLIRSVRAALSAPKPARRTPAKPTSKPAAARKKPAPSTNRHAT